MLDLVGEMRLERLQKFRCPPSVIDLRMRIKFCSWAEHSAVSQSRLTRKKWRKALRLRLRWKRSFAEIKLKVGNKNHWRLNWTLSVCGSYGCWLRFLTCSKKSCLFAHAVIWHLPSHWWRQGDYPIVLNIRITTSY